jgi:hypothetical protein
MGQSSSNALNIFLRTFSLSNAGHGVYSLSRQLAEQREREAIPVEGMNWNKD